MDDQAELQAKRDRWFAEYDQGRTTLTQVRIQFYLLLAGAANDEAALSLCDELPAWFQRPLRDSLSELAERDYYLRWTSLEDLRSREAIEEDSWRVQQALRRLAPEMLKRLAAE
ncbi:hypothetical protein [Blastopirellula marina]|uniref:Uncharacterized protein n=1 Tax=Blastopirellula marina TaxID=124 RepID=A0A2S8GR04_9BACT|nr:hypothetical protein [Blastopirellula marina]PQO46870.1 hypothetical protein C5Y93_06885 [Blastopirellula marina]